MQVKKEMEHLICLVEENIQLSFVAIETGSSEHSETIRKNEEVINFTNSALTKFLIKLSVDVEESTEETIGAYFHVLNDLERIGDHAKNFHEIGTEMSDKKIMFSEKARAEIASMYDEVMRMLALSKDAFENNNKENLSELAELENGIDNINKELIASHFSRLVEGNCSVDVSPYFSSVVSGLERVADHIVNIGFSITDPTGAENA